MNRAFVPMPRRQTLGCCGRSLNGLGATAPTNPFTVRVGAVSVQPLVVTPAQAQKVVTAATQASQGVVPTVAQAIQIIKAAVPAPANFARNVPAPSKTGTHATSGLHGFGVCTDYRCNLNMGVLLQPRRGPYYLGGLGASAVASAAGGASAGATVGSVVPGVGTAIGAAVGAVLGVIGGLFGKKKAVPRVSAADIQQAQTWWQQYQQVAGSAIGRNFTPTAISDMLTAAAIMDPGFWGDTQSNQISVPAVTNFVNDELPKRMNDFFNAMSSVPTGGTVTLTDDASILGHGKTNKSVTFTFTSPGVNAPSYVLGPIFAQYFYTMCTIFVSASSCQGHLNAPLPQMYTDFLDYFRSSHPQWDTPQPNVVTGTDVGTTAPTIVGTAATATQTPGTNAPVASGAAIPTASPSAVASSGMAVGTTAPAIVTTPAGQSIDVSTLVASLKAQGDSNAQAFQAALAQLQQAGVNTSSPQVQQAVDQAVVAPTPTTGFNLAGMNWWEILLLVGAAAPFVYKAIKGGKRGSRS